MPIHRLLQNMPMGPEEITRLTTAYEQALRSLGLVDRNDLDSRDGRQENN